MVENTEPPPPIEKEPNPILVMFKEKTTEYWEHIKKAIVFAYERRVDKAKEIVVPGEATDRIIKEIEDDRRDVFDKEVKHIEQLFLEGIKEMEEM